MKYAMCIITDRNVLAHQDFYRTLIATAVHMMNSAVMMAIVHQKRLVSEVNALIRAMQRNHVEVSAFQRIFKILNKLVFYSCRFIYLHS